MNERGSSPSALPTVPSTALPTVQQLRCLVALADHQHFGRAAAALRMTQPPLSRQVRELERVVGAPLLVRGTQGVTQWTPAGEVLLAEARRILALLGGGTDTARRIGAGRAGRVRLGFIPAAATTVLGPLVAEIRAELAELEVTLNELSMAEQFARLRHGDLDLGLTWPPPPGTELASHVVRSEPLVVALPADHHLAHDEPIAVRDLTEESWIGYDPVEASHLHQLGAGLLGARWAAGTVQVHQVTSALALVAGGMGLALVPESAGQGLPYGVVTLPIADAAPQVHHHAVWHAETFNPALVAVVHYLQERTRWPVATGGDA